MTQIMKIIATSSCSKEVMAYFVRREQEIVATSMLEDEKWIDGFLQLSRDRLAARNKLVRKILDEAGIKYYLGSNAGFFLWIDLSPFLPEQTWAGENALTERLIANKVFITDGQAMAAEEPGWYRLIFSQDERVVEEGLERYYCTRPADRSKRFRWSLRLTT